MLASMVYRLCQMGIGVGVWGGDMIRDSTHLIMSARDSMLT